MASISRITARARHRVITLEDLVALDYTRSAVRHLVRTERLWRVYPAVYALEGPISREGWALAAALACRGHASRLTAAAAHGYRDFWPDPPSVTIVGRTGARGPERVDVHHARRLEVGIVDHIPVTSPAQTVIDCARLLDDPSLKRLLRQAEYHGLRLADVDRPGLPRPLRRLLDRYVVGSGLTESELEARFFELCARAGIPLPEVQARFPARRRIDFVWHDARLIVETDGRRAHRGALVADEDRARDRDHLLLGYATMRFTWAEVEREPALVAGQVIAIRAQRLGRASD